MLLCSIRKDPLPAIDRLFFRNFSFGFLFYLTFYVYLYELDKVAVSPGHEKVTTHRSRLCVERFWQVGMSQSGA